MRVLWLKYGEILPADTGGKLRSYNLIRRLAERVELTFVCYSHQPLTIGFAESLAASLPTSHAWGVTDIPGWRELSARSVWLGVRHGIPLNVSRFSSRDARARLATLVDAQHFDVGICDFLTPTEVYPRTPGFASVLFEHNVEWALWQRRTETLPHGAQRALYQWETRRTRAHEAAMLRRFDATLAVSELDRQALTTLEPRADVRVVNTGVDVAEFASMERSGSRSENLVVFVGSMDWQPNEDGVLWFMAEVWPKVIAAAPGSRFRIVGRRPPQRIRDLAAATVEITGDVDSVVPHLHEAAVMVVPLRAGGGTRLKIFEAMAAGAVIVSTTVGAEGLDVKHGRDLILADTADDLARSLIELLQSPDRRRMLADAASTAVKRWDWTAVAATLESTLRDVHARWDGRRESAVAC